MSNIENGNSGISLWTAMKISRVLGCSIDQMVDGNKDTSDDKHEKKMMIDIETLADALKLIAIKIKLRIMTDGEIYIYLCDYIHIIRPLC